MIRLLPLILLALAGGCAAPLPSSVRARDWYENGPIVCMPFGILNLDAGARAPDGGAPDAGAPATKDAP
jgi:hypothetical protein